MQSTRRETAVLWHPYLALVLTALAVQLVGHYHAGALVIGRYFYLSWVLLRIAVPLAVLGLLGIPLARAGLGRPRLDRTSSAVVLGTVTALLILFGGSFFYQGYFHHYASAFSGPRGDTLARFVNFMTFTGSTLVGWEFLHRGFLLFGIRHVLTVREKLSAPAAARIAISVVWIMEVVFHFKKPEPEALGLLAGSPFLSWLALRTGSFWIPLAIHLLVELLFFTALVLR